MIALGSGTGAEIAKRFAAEGYTVALARRNAEALTRLAAEISAAGGMAKTFGVDAPDEAAVAALFAETEQALGPVQVAVFNAAGFVRNSIVQTTSDDFATSGGQPRSAGFWSVARRRAG
jgi:NAD(P)-dependent dehydrogenase (short-subunit alcohol dehydrogenase family)